MMRRKNKKRHPHITENKFIVLTTIERQQALIFVFSNKTTVEVFCFFFVYLFGFKERDKHFYLWALIIISSIIANFLLWKFKILYVDLRIHCDLQKCQTRRSHFTSCMLGTWDINIAWLTAVPFLFLISAVELLKARNVGACSKW